MASSVHNRCKTQQAAKCARRHPATPPSHSPQAPCTQSSPARPPRSTREVMQQKSQRSRSVTYTPSLFASLPVGWMLLGGIIAGPPTVKFLPVPLPAPLRVLRENVQGSHSSVLIVHFQSDGLHTPAGQSHHSISTSLELPSYLIQVSLAS